MEQLREGIQYNSPEIIRQAINNPNIDLNDALVELIDYNDNEIIELVLYKGANDYNKVLLELIRALGNHDLIPLILHYYDLGITLGQTRITYDTFKRALDTSISSNDVTDIKLLIKYVSEDDIIHITINWIY